MFIGKVVRLPVRTALLQNSLQRLQVGDLVRLPVRTALLQNLDVSEEEAIMCDYQSERHCSKTYEPRRIEGPRCDYQSERHCSKTKDDRIAQLTGAITSQNGTAPKR